MKNLFTLLSFFILQTIHAQYFTDPFPAAFLSPFTGVETGNVTIADVDGDMNPDVLISGLATFNMVTKLYLNHGDNVFIETDSNPFAQVGAGANSFSDIDNDGDLDLLITGSSITNEEMTVLYSNDGDGVFSEIPNTPFEAVSHSATAFADVDEDGDEDVLITGHKGVYPGHSTKLYINNGTGNFTEDTNASFEPASNGTADFADVDGDGDLDVLITGEAAYPLNTISKLYLNDGQGQFTETDTPFLGVFRSAVAFADIDNDGDQDVLIAGQLEINNHQPITKLYTNDGQGNFTEVKNIPIEGMLFAAIDFADLDKDGDLDFIILGEDYLFGEKITRLYLNDGLGNFTAFTDTPFEEISRGTLVVADVNLDTWPDVLMTGTNANFDRLTKLYLNIGDPTSTEEIPAKSTLQFDLYPNPTLDTYTTLELTHPHREQGLIQVFNLYGQTMHIQKIEVQQGENTFLLPAGNWTPGIYFVSLNMGTSTGTQKLIVK